MLKELIAEEASVPVLSKVWRASEVGECETFLGHLRLGHDALPFTGRVRHMLQDGYVHERDIVNRLESKGVKVWHSYASGQLEVDCVDDPYVVGHPDGVVDVPQRLLQQFSVDYADESFKPTSAMLLEVTAPNHFTFLRLKAQHLREVWWRKYVQIQLYLFSRQMEAYLASKCALVVVKNKNTSELYEEGVSLDERVIEKVVNTLRKVEELASDGRVSDFRCSDARRTYCRYRHLCFPEPPETRPLPGSILRGEMLKEADVLEAAVAVWRRGKMLKEEGEDLVRDVRDQFGELLEQYGCRGITMEGVTGMLVSKVSRSVDLDLLQKKYPDVYEEVVAEKTSTYVRVA